MPAFSIQPLITDDRDWVSQFATEHWGADIMIIHGHIYTLNELPGFLARTRKKRVGLITYQIQGSQCVILSLDSIQPGQGIGTALIEAVKTTARQAGCKRLWLITTNDNLHALGFYQKRGFELAAIHRHAVTRARKLKPQIPAIGANNIPLRDEIELEYVLE